MREKAVQYLYHQCSGLFHCTGTREKTSSKPNEKIIKIKIDFFQAAGD